MVCVNRHTGEVFYAEEVNLCNLCGGWVNDQFKRDLELLAGRMVPDDGGAISIEIKVQKQFDGEGTECLMIGVETGMKLPKVKMVDETPKHISSTNEVVIKGERQSLVDCIDVDHQIGGGDEQ